MLVSTSVSNSDSWSPRATSAAAVPTYYAPRPRNRNSSTRPKPKPYTQLPTPSPSAHSSTTSPSPPPVDRWSCKISGCTKSYGRTHDLVRHLDSAHHAALRDADDVALLGAGVPAASLDRLRELMSRRHGCTVCSAQFSRRDALSRHMDEQGHRPVAQASAPLVAPEPAPVQQLPLPPAGYQWSLVPVPAPVAVVEWDPLQPLWDEFLAPSPALVDMQILSAPHLVDLSAFPPLEPAMALFPADELYADALRLCAGAPPPSEEAIDAALRDLGMVC